MPRCEGMFQRVCKMTTVRQCVMTPTPSYTLYQILSENETRKRSDTVKVTYPTAGLDHRHPEKSKEKKKKKKLTRSL